MKRLLSVVLLMLPALAWAVGGSTHVTVRALAHDAKLIPGARVVIENAHTGDVLAMGATEGGTGDTDLIMRKPAEHGADVYDTEGAAAFTADLTLEAPTRVRITASEPDSGASVAKTLWLAPGENVEGNGIVLELYGLKVALTVPAGNSVPGDGGIGVTAQVHMLCGCPVSPGGLWDADGFTVTAQLLREEEVIESAALGYAGKTSTFSGTLPSPGPGDYLLRVVAAQPEKGNFGTAETPLAVTD